jgi:hypothetical protein
MSGDERTKPDGESDELQNLPERPIADLDQVKGGATLSNPVPIPYPTTRLEPGVIQSINPCW